MEYILCTEDNLDELEEFYNKEVLYLDETINYPKWVYNNYPSRSTIKAVIEKKEQYAYLENGKIVGAFVFNEEPGGKYENAKVSFNRGEYLIIHTLAIDHGHYKKGIASKIVKYCIEKAKKEGYKAICADIVPTNIPSRKLFEKSGFVYLGDFDLERNIEDIPVFSMYELKL
ncbi:acyl-CoA N-acyltransferase [Anaeromyces robustus]|uniref:Acyl-CoA N-acyltransferase n=1 Tax=Anaeromyces robustus TaxID=1754192 RepID=A0A1Y1XBU2_9FUNG|nr:acyl-CoA N-acyltransferase [Anaeromyces robustus]|eukprot:ORX82886.1 acyl-CoA N-acyltransferase [Anaeromyces robustus]